MVSLGFGIAGRTVLCGPYLCRIIAPARQGSEAYLFLKQLFRRLPDDPYAQHGTILERIQELEVELNIPSRDCFVP